MNIVVGVCGGIAAYKSLHLIRLIVKAGFSIQVIPTKNALKFVGEASFSAISGRSVSSDLFAESEYVSHISAGKKADIIVVAPTTANTIAKLAGGFCSDLLTSTILAATCPVVLCPAMHTEMWNNPATQHNLQTLKERGYIIIEPHSGELSSGDSGMGRIPEPEDIFEYLQDLKILEDNSVPYTENSYHLAQSHDSADTAPKTGTDFVNFSSRNSESSILVNELRCESIPSRPSINEKPGRKTLSNKTIVISAGGTREPIDPVRFIGNRSTGIMGISIALAAADLDAEVILVASNIDEAVLAPCRSRNNIQVFSVETAQELQLQMHKFSTADVIIMCAAVADYRVKTQNHTKIKKTNQKPEKDNPTGITLELVPNPDILASLVQLRANLPGITIGFAAETGDAKHDYLWYGGQKALAKGTDFLVVNQVGKQIGFGPTDSKVTVLDKYGQVVTEFLGSKQTIGNELMHIISHHFDT